MDVGIVVITVAVDSGHPIAIGIAQVDHAGVQGLSFVGREASAVTSNAKQNEHHQHRAHGFSLSAKKHAASYWKPTPKQSGVATILDPSLLPTFHIA